MIERIIDFILKKSYSYSKIECSLESARDLVFKRFSLSALRSTSFNDFVKTFDSVVENRPYSLSEYIQSSGKHVDYCIFYIGGVLYIVSVPDDIRMKCFQLIQIALDLQKINNINKGLEKIPGEVKELFPELDVAYNSDQKSLSELYEDYITFLVDYMYPYEQLSHIRRGTKTPNDVIRSDNEFTNAIRKLNPNSKLKQ